MKILYCCNTPTSEVLQLQQFYEKKGHIFDIVHNLRNIELLRTYDIVFSVEWFAGGSFLELKSMYRKPSIHKVSDSVVPSDIRDIINKYLSKEPQVINDTEEIKENIDYVTPRLKSESYFKWNNQLYNKIYELIDKTSKHCQRFLLHGKTGVGKEHIARMIHDKSEVFGNFVAVDCGSISEELIYSELFGHIKGSFTGAYKDKRGYFVEAQNGTVFFDEIENLSMKGQIALLRVLQEKEFKQVGSTKAINFTSKVICASNVDLQKLVNEGKFRKDLYYRINQIEISIPSLDEMVDDVPNLIEFLYTKIVTELKLSTINPQLIEQCFIDCFPYEGNIREIESYLTKHIILESNSDRDLDGIELLLSSSY